MSTDRTRHALNGATMGTRWSALFFAPASFDASPVRAALQAAVDEVDAQMSTWKPDSALMRLNATPVGIPVPVPARLWEVLELGLTIGRQSGGAFDIGMGDAVSAWGFGPDDADPDHIRAAMDRPRVPASDLLTLDAASQTVTRAAPVSLDLNGIAKGYGVDRLAQVLAGFGIADALVGIDGEMRAMGLRPDGTPWAIAVEAPEDGRRDAHSVLALQDGAVATSGDYRHWVEVQGRRLSHTMNPQRGAPIAGAPASVTVVAATCAEADAWATALMVLGAEAGAALARSRKLNALFLLRDSDGIRPLPVGALFGEPAA